MSLRAEGTSLRDDELVYETIGLTFPSMFSGFVEKTGQKEV